MAVLPTRMPPALAAREFGPTAWLSTTRLFEPFTAMLQVLQSAKREFSTTLPAPSKEAPTTPLAVQLRIVAPDSKRNARSAIACAEHRSNSESPIPLNPTPHPLAAQSITTLPPVTVPEEMDTPVPHTVNVQCASVAPPAELWIPMLFLLKPIRSTRSPDPLLKTPYWKPVIVPLLMAIELPSPPMTEIPKVLPAAGKERRSSKPLRSMVTRLSPTVVSLMVIAVPRLSQVRLLAR
ncbi:MAG: hypothetical protein IPK26_24745 [Planctomycetes bacterium]|nr:hypothetical protein [Planctomycetota bacterium]